MTHKKANSIYIENVTDNEQSIDFQGLKRMIQWILSFEDHVANWSINIIFVNNDVTTNLNKKFLGKNTATDVLAFNLSDTNEALGEIYVSLEQAKTQATEYKVSFQNEISRLVAHGVYHLLGYDDHTEPERQVMTEKENKALQHSFANYP